MDINNIQLLKENLDAMDSAISWLKRSVGHCRSGCMRKNSNQ